MYIAPCDEKVNCKILNVFNMCQEQMFLDKKII